MKQTSFLLNAAHQVIISIIAFSVLVALNVHAQQTKVVVIPLGGDEPSPSFRIVPGATTSVLNGNPVDPDRGRLEYTFDPNPDPTSLWGTVCEYGLDDYYKVGDAICKDLGYRGGNTMLSASIIPGTSENVIISMDQVACPDGASSFSQCSFRKYFGLEAGGTPEGNCTHDNDIGINCYGKNLSQKLGFRVIPNTLEPTATPGGSAYAIEGRLEVSIPGVGKGTVCDDNSGGSGSHSTEERGYIGSAICRDLGYYNGGEIMPRSLIVDGSGPIGLDDIGCEESDYTFSMCVYKTVHNCVHGEDIGLRCLANPD